MVWKNSFVGSEIELLYGKSYPAKNRIKGKNPVFGSNGIIDYCEDYLLKGPGLIIGRKGTVGEVHYTEKNFWPIDTTYFVRTSQNNFLRFWYYFFKYENLTTMNTHSAVPGLNRDAVLQLKCNIPSFNVQKEIASILSLLDLKIELNNQTNQTLEKIAQSLFKHWFIDFEFPDENNHNLPYKSSGGEMVDSELGKIPKGWVVGNLGMLISEIMPGNWGNETFSSEYNKKIFCIRGTDIPEIVKGNFIELNERFLKSNGLGKFLLREEDIIIEISGGSPIQSTGRVLLISDDLLTYYKNSIICSNFCKILRPKSNYHSYFLYFLMSYLYNKGIFFNYENGTTGIKNLDLKYLLLKLMSIIPNEKIMENFSEKIVSLFKIIHSNAGQSKTLSQIRDSLLPKLMTGKIRVNIEDENSEDSSNA